MVMYDKHFTEQYIRDQKELANYYLNEDAFPFPKYKNKMHISKYGIELILNPKCNQSCDYCYLSNFGEKLYPDLFSTETIIENVKLFLDYIYNIRKNFVYSIELFGGEIIQNNLVFDILDILMEYFEKIKINHPYLFGTDWINIIIPNNLSWVQNRSDLVEKLYKYKDKLEKKYMARIIFSWSTDGLYAIDTREKKELTQEYYDKMIPFCKKMNTGAHPMVSAKNVKKWVNGNYEWWMEYYKNISNGSKSDWGPMILEVRNDDWDDESIEDFKQLLNIIMKKRLEMCNNDVEALAQHLFSDVELSESFILPPLQNYDLIRLNNYCNNVTENERTSCSMQTLIHLNCTNLSLPICHRLSYPLLTAIYFIADEKKQHIIDIHPHNLDAYFGLKFLKDYNQPGCYNCDYRNICLKGCFGAQYENTGDLLVHCKSVCKFFKEKYDHIIKLYNQYGVLDIALKKDYIKNKGMKEFLLLKSKDLGYFYDSE